MKSGISLYHAVDPFLVKGHSGEDAGVAGGLAAADPPRRHPHHVVVAVTQRHQGTPGVALHR